MRNGSAASYGYEGRVEICYNNTYGTICDDLWNENAAAVVCRSFNGKSRIYSLSDTIKFLNSTVSHGAPISGRDSKYGSGTGQVILDNVVCNGSEQNLLHCSHAGVLHNNCNHNEDAAVICGSKPVILKWEI